MAKDKTDAIGEVMVSSRHFSGQRVGKVLAARLLGDGSKVVDVDLVLIPATDQGFIDTLRQCALGSSVLGIPVFDPLEAAKRAELLNLHPHLAEWKQPGAATTGGPVAALRAPGKQPE